MEFRSGWFRATPCPRRNFSVQMSLFSAAMLAKSLEIYPKWTHNKNPILNPDFNAYIAGVTPSFDRIFRYSPASPGFYYFSD